MNNSKRVSSITYGALMTALLGVVLFFNRQLAGALDIYLFWIIPIPVIVYIMKFGVSRSFVLGASMMLISFILATPATLFYVAGSVIAGIVYGYGMTKQWTAMQLIMSVIVISLLMMTCTVFLFAGVFGYDLAAEMAFYRETMNMTIEKMGAGNNEAVKNALAMFLQDNVLLTFIIGAEVLASIMEGILVHLLAYIILKKLKMELPPMKPLGEIKAPRAVKLFVFTVVAATILASLTGVSQYNVIITLAMALVYAICMLYGYLLIVTFVSWRYKAKGTRTIMTLILTMTVFFFPPFMYGVGLLDIFTNTRQNIIEELKKNGEQDRKA